MILISDEKVGAFFFKLRFLLLNAYIGRTYLTHFNLELLVVSIIFL